MTWSLNKLVSVSAHMMRTSFVRIETKKNCLEHEKTNNSTPPPIPKLFYKLLLSFLFLFFASQQFF